MAAAVALCVTVCAQARLVPAVDGAVPLLRAEGSSVPALEPPALRRGSPAPAPGASPPERLRLGVSSLQAPEVLVPAFVPPQATGSAMPVNWWLHATASALRRPRGEEEVAWQRLQQVGVCADQAPASAASVVSSAPRVVLRIQAPREGGAPVARVLAEHPAADVARMTSCLWQTARQLGSGGAVVAPAAEDPAGVPLRLRMPGVLRPSD